MCGICGILARPSHRPDPEIAGRMAALLRHRGPDGMGGWSDDRVALAQTRLAVVDLSPAGDQPMVSSSGRYVIAFNGEVYNHHDLRRRLEAEGEGGWRGHSDTETLLAAIERWGLARAIERVVGMFAFALWDRRDHVLTLARDRFGEKPLYYGKVGGAFVFASELKAFHALPSWDPVIDRGALALFMRHACVPGPFSIYEGIHKLPPGSLLTLREGDTEPKLEVYWSLFEAAQNGQDAPFTGSADDAVEVLSDLLKQSLAGQMLADVPLGAFLSGGIDSSTIVAELQTMSARPVRTFTIGFHQPDYNEADHARNVAEHLGTDHTELYVTEQDALATVPQLADIYSEPFADSSQIPTVLVSRLARQHVTVALSGDGGDELFAGYARYGLANAIWRRLSRMPRWLRSAAARSARLIPPRLYDGAISAAGPLVPQRYRMRQPGDKIHRAADAITAATLDEIYRRVCSNWDPAAALLADDEPATMFTGAEPIPAFGDHIRRMMYIDLRSYLVDDILAKVDRAAMASSLETRVPLLDHHLVAFTLSLPPSVLDRDGQSKWPLRQILYRSVPRAIVERPKMGFGVPIDHWLRGPLRDWCEDLLSQDRLNSSGLFRTAAIRDAWTEHRAGRGDHAQRLWCVLMFLSWQDANAKAVAAPPSFPDAIAASA